MGDKIRIHARACNILNYKSIYTCNVKTAQHSIILKLEFGTPLLNKMPGRFSKTSTVVRSNERRVYCRLYHS